MDLELFKLINISGHFDSLSPLMIAVSSNTFAAVLVFCILLVMWATSESMRSFARFFILLVVSFTVTDAGAYYLLKDTIGRLRPCKALPLDQIFVLDGCAGFMSFPSNHAANSAAIFTCLLLAKAPNYLINLSFFVALAVGYSRIYLGVHYPTDIIGGYVWGTLVTVASHKLMTWTKPIKSL